MPHLPEHLLAGYRNFMSGRYLTESGRYRTLAREGQAPETMIVACCDSRAAPEAIFDAGPWRTLRAAQCRQPGAALCARRSVHSTSAALEFAVQSLKVKNIVVMGHGRCGGIRAALDTNSAPLSPGDFIGKWMSLIAPAAETVSSSTFMTATETPDRAGNASRSAIRSPISGPFLASRSSKARADCRCTAPGSTSRPASLGDEQGHRRLRAAGDGIDHDPEKWEPVFRPRSWSTRK